MPREAGQTVKKIRGKQLQVTCTPGRVKSFAYERTWEILGEIVMNRIRPRSLTSVHSLLVALLLGTVMLAAPSGARPASAAPGHEVSSHATMPKPQTGNFVQRLIGALRSSSLEVSVGYPMLALTPSSCAYSYPVYHNCWGNNPAAPYVVPVVKPWPEEYVDPTMENGVGRTRPGYSSTYRFDPKEAIIFFGKMPPPGRYMGLQTWIWSTGWVSDDSPWDVDAYGTFEPYAGPLIQYLFDTVPVSDSVPDLLDRNLYRVQSFSSIDNIINNVVMENQSGPAWNQVRYFVITPDRHTDAAVRQVLVSLGVDEGKIFTERIPNAFFQDPDPYPFGQNPFVGPLGLAREAVDFITLFRYAMPDNESAANAWRKSLPLTVLRVRRISGVDPERYGELKADARTGVNEWYLYDHLEALVSAVKNRAQGLGLSSPEPDVMIDLQSELGGFGPACRNIGMNCLGDNQDASFFLINPRPLDTGNVYAVVGTLATETGNATYVGLSVNDASRLAGVLNIADTQLKGSAGNYAGALYGPVANWDKFFVHFFTRDCAAIADLTDGACTTITKAMVPRAGDDKAPGDAELHGMFSAAVRAYVAVGSKRGPNPSLQLRPRVLTFSNQ